MDSRTTLSSSLSLILEDTAFVFTALSAEAPAPFGEEVIQASMDYSGDQTGTLRLRMTVPFALHLAEEMMVEGDPETLPEEIAGELLNIVAGLWIVNHYGERVLFELSCPATERAPGETISAPDSDGATLITDDGDRIDFLMAA